MNGMAALYLFCGMLLMLAFTGCASLTPSLQSPRLTMGKPKDVGIDPSVIRQMEQRIETAIKEQITPGAVLMAGHRGTIIEEQAFGNSRLQPSPEPMMNDAIFDLASLSKVFGTATASMLLIEEGKLRLSDRVSAIIPEFAANDKSEVRVEDLMTHRSGLKSYESVKAAEGQRGSLPTQADALIYRIAGLPKTYPTGQCMLYSCLNYLTLARVNETVAGVNQHELLKKRVWEPLGMKDTGYLLTDEQRKRCAPTAKKADGTWMQGETHDPLANYHLSTPQHCPGNAGLFSTAQDLSIYCQMIINEGAYGNVRIFKPETIQLMTSGYSVRPVYDSKKSGPGTDISRRGLGLDRLSRGALRSPFGPGRLLPGPYGDTRALMPG